MATETDPAGNGEADSGAAQRYKSERDEARQQASEATRVLASYRKRDAARDALKGKVEDPDSVADLIAPHLEDVELKDVAAHIASEQFAPRLASFKGATETPPTGDESEEETPATETPGFGGGPSLGGGANGGGTPLTPGQEKIVVGSKEWNDLITGGDRDAIDAAYKAGRIVEPVKGY